MWVCGIGDGIHSLAAEWEAGWLSRYPRHHTLSIVLYEVCDPDAVSTTLAGRFRSPESHTMSEHVLAAAHSQRRGQRIADAMFLVPDIWVTPWRSSMMMTPRHFVNTLSELLKSKADGGPLDANTFLARNFTEEAPLGRWLFVFDGPPDGTPLVCEKYSTMVSTHCPVPSKMDTATPEVVAFSTSLLRSAPLAEWEPFIAHRDGTMKHWRTDFSLLVTLLTREANETELSVVTLPGLSANQDFDEYQVEPDP